MLLNIANVNLTLMFQNDILAIRCERFEARYRLCDNVCCKYLWRFFHACRSLRSR